MPGFITTVVLSALMGKIGERLSNETATDGFWMCFLAGLLGSWIGAYMPLFNNVGPILFGIALIPAVLCSAAFIFSLSILKYIVQKSS
jgi:uncharacterized membrane protein YeaQ/YmgE (transglycosylase-associated protein family)